MQKLLLVGLGGILGTMSRYALSGLLVRWKGGSLFPYETLVVNVIGCLAIGVLAGLAETRDVLSVTTRAFLFVGVLGGFTTFSSFGYDTIHLVRDGQTGIAIGSVLLQLALGLGAVWFGDTVARALGSA